MRRKFIEILPRTLGQEFLIDALDDTANSIIFVTGPAGSGKTYMATLFAIRELRAGNFDKIVITRPAVSTDEEHGFLPGTLTQKMEPWMLPIIDVFKENYSPRDISYMMETGMLEISPLAFMRGRTFKNAIVIADETQNTKISQMKMLLTRIGEGSRMIITGDIEQYDTGFDINGLKDIMDRIETKNLPGFSVVRFSRRDVVRHPVIDEVLKLYG